MGDALRLRDVVDRTGFDKGMCFRLLQTLYQCGFLEKTDASRYRLTLEVRRRRRCRIGYAAQGQDTSFAREVQAGLVKAAERESVDLVIIDNRYQPKTALRNVEFPVREGVHLVIEFQTDEAVAPAIAATYSVGYFPEQYGDRLIKLAIDILTKKAVPRAVFVHHHVITRENVDHYYPNDVLLGVSTYAMY